jgi:hypothetical protein
LPLFRQRLCCGGWLWFAAKERQQLIPKSVNLFANGNDFISRVFDLNKRLFCGTIQLTPCLDVFNQSGSKQTDADRINL